MAPSRFRLFSVEERTLQNISDSRGYISCGFMDENGRVVIEPVYDLALSFSEGLAAVRLNRRWGYIDHSGRPVIEFGSFEEPETTSRSIRLQPPREFSDGLAAFRGEGQIGYLDRKGAVIIEPTFAMAGSFHEGLASVAAHIGGGSEANKKSMGATAARFGCIDLSGNLKVALSDDFFSLGFEDCHFSEGLIRYRAEVNGTDKYGFMNRQGEPVIDPTFDSAEHFSEGLAAVWIGGAGGYIGHDGCLAVPVRYSLCGDFAEGLAPVEVGGKCGYIDPAGEWVIEPRFDEAGSFSQGLAMVMIGREVKYIDHGGQFVLEVPYHAAEAFHEGLATFALWNAA